MIGKEKEFVNPVPQLWSWIKRHRQDILLGIAVLLLSLLSFGIGYLKAREDLKQPLFISEQP